MIGDSRMYLVALFAICVLGDTEQLHRGPVAQDPATDFFSKWTPTDERAPAPAAPAQGHRPFSDYDNRQPLSATAEKRRDADEDAQAEPALTTEEKALFADAVYRADSKDGGFTSPSKPAPQDQHASQGHRVPAPPSRSVTAEHIDVHLQRRSHLGVLRRPLPAPPLRSVRTIHRAAATVQASVTAHEATPLHVPASAADEGSSTHGTIRIFSSQKTVRDIAADAPTVYTKSMVAQLAAHLQTVGDVMRSTASLVDQRLQNAFAPPPPPPAKAGSAEVHGLTFAIDVVVAWRTDTFHDAQLRYVLRGVAQNAPWVHHIYVIVPHARSGRPAWFQVCCFRLPPDAPCCIADEPAVPSSEAVVDRPLHNTKPQRASAHVCAAAVGARDVRRARGDLPRAREAVPADEERVRGGMLPRFDTRPR
jgi:hypothetical protein